METAKEYAASIALKLEICPNEGYSAAGVLEHRNTLTVGALREMLEGYDDEVRIVTYDLNNARGASWGCIPADTWMEEVDIADEDEE